MRWTAQSVQAMRELLEKNRKDPYMRDASRVSSPAYMPPQCRLVPEGNGGAPLSSARSCTPRSRPSSAPAGGRQARSGDSWRGREAKTERWRETGHVRWPQRADEVVKAKPPSDGDPISRGVPEQPNWTGELWIRSLRRPGLMELQEAARAYTNLGIETIQQEWASDPPPPWVDAVPYGGATTSAKTAIPHSKNNEQWVDKPVSTGKMALNHMNGQRYRFNMKSRGLDPDRKRPASARARKATFPRAGVAGDGAYF